jgi:hypothetical protein
MTKYYDIRPDNNPLFEMEVSPVSETERMLAHYKTECDRLTSLTSKVSREISAIQTQLAKFKEPKYLAEYETLINKRKKLKAEMKTVKAAQKLAKAVLL